MFEQQNIIEMVGQIKQANKVQEIRKKARFSPYGLDYMTQIRYIGQTTNWELLQGDQYIERIKNFVKQGYQELDETLYMFSGRIDVLDLEWKFWRHPNSINKFLNEMQDQVSKAIQVKVRMSASSNQINEKFKDIIKIKQWSASQIKKLVEWLNLVLEHPYMKKSIPVLQFINHCLPSNLWNLKIHQQSTIKDERAISAKLFGKPAPIKQFLTVTCDGILISTKNLLVSKIERMITFTNQFSCTIKNVQGNLMVRIISFQNQSLKVNFFKDFIEGVNFYIGVKKAHKQSGLINTRFNSFSRPRKNCFAKLYNDGVDYFQDMCNMLLSARNQVLITDWWLTPYFVLKRPGQITEKHNRLDGILKRIADRGVRIFIILFREPVNLICNDSQQAHFYLESLSRNIRVRRHPIIPQLWSHHQKSCIIDQTYGFMGGLDICYGRWDTPAHHLNNQNDYWNGADYTNQRLRGFVPGTTDQITNSPIDRQTQPRMPWHDIGLHIQGDAVIDLARHFIQYWHYVDIQKGHDCIVWARTINKRCQRSYKYENIDKEQLEGEQFFRKSQVQHERSFGQKIRMLGRGTRSFVVGVDRRLPELLIQVRQGSVQGQMQLQLCRSASPWSIGAIQRQQSIHRAYQDLIDESENLIYIQNQFFMGKQNKIVQSLARRIKRAYRKNQNFKVIVVMPLLPGFQGDIENPQCTALRTQVHNQYQSINRGTKSLFAILQKEQNMNVHNYIRFFCLRNHALFNKKPVTEIIYIHSKLMIVDDKRAIIGSANINDRSLLGNRDSELAMVIQQNNGDLKNTQKAFIYDLRKRLFDEHFSLNNQQTMNINSQQVWNKINQNAKNNTTIYRKIFGCYPDDNITVGQQIKKLKSQANPSLYQQLTPKIVGHAVEFPLEFMKDQNLQLKMTTKQGILGEDAFI